MRINFKPNDLHFKTDLEKAVYEKAKAVIIKKIETKLTQSELDKVSITVFVDNRQGFSFKINGDEKIVEKIKKLM